MGHYVVQAIVGGVVRPVRSVIAELQSRVRLAPVALVHSGRTSPPAATDGPAVDLATTPSPYVQPDHTTCGSSVLVLARMINHPDYARTILDPPAAEHVPDRAAHFHADVLAMHELTNTSRDERGRWQLPWPKGLGTLPWAVARRMSEPGACGVTGSAYGVSFANPARLEAHLDAITTALSAGHVVPIFIGDARSPRHVVLAVDTDRDSFGLYDPSKGVRVGVERRAVVADRMAVAGWDQLWLSILPRP